MDLNKVVQYIILVENMFPMRHRAMLSLLFTVGVNIKPLSQ